MNKRVEKYFELEAKVQTSPNNDKRDININDDFSKDDRSYEKSFINDNSINDENTHPNL